MTITLGMHDPREPERARKGPKGPDEASMTKKKLLVETNLNYEAMIWDGCVEALQKKIGWINGANDFFSIS